MSAAVYRAYDAEGTLLYVGCTVALDARMRDHEKNSPWWFFHCHLEVKRFASHKAALAEELRLIQTEHPRWNVRDRSPGHPDGPVRCITSAPHLALEIQTYRAWKAAKSKAAARELRKAARTAESGRIAS